LKSIYLDNYRGFNKQIIPLKSVNFLVGENSTGKTSFLASLKILGSHRFWFRPSFDDPDLHFSYFSEIVSNKGENKKSFTIGFFDDSSLEEESSKDEKTPTFRLITFKNEEGMPVVHKYSFMSPIGLISTIISDNSLRYKVMDVEVGDTLRDFINICTEEHSLGHPTGYKKFSKKGFPRDLFFANAYHFVVADLAGKDLIKNNKKITFQIEIDAPECKWIAPIRAKPEKIYLHRASDYSPEGGHIPNLLNKLLNSSKGDTNNRTINAIEEFGLSSGLFDSVGVKRFGKEASSPFEVNVNLGGSDLLVSNVGYGVSQVLPIILESRRRSSAEYIAIQQPEVHLHPKAQASLGEFIYQSGGLNGNKFVIETHSDYLIDRFRLCTNKAECKNAQVLFFERVKEGNIVHCISIDKNGGYPLDQPEAFRKFFLNEELEMLRL
jgi:predicted ATPase